jgi:hypothetical protein
MKNTLSEADAELHAILSTSEAAELAHLTNKRINIFCIEGRIAAKRIGRDWAISRHSFEQFLQRARPTGRPAETKTASKPSAIKAPAKRAKNRAKKKGGKILRARR